MRPRISIKGFVRPSVRGSVGPWVRRSVGPSVRPSVGHVFLKNRGNRVLRTTKQVNSSKFKKILSFSHLLDASLFVSNLFYKDQQKKYQAGKEIEIATNKLTIMSLIFG